MGGTDIALLSHSTLTSRLFTMDYVSESGDRGAFTIASPQSINIIKRMVRIYIYIYTQ